MAERSDVCVFVPTYNEAATIGEVVRDFRERGFENVLVVDGDSTDDTREIAAAAGAEVRVQSGHGNGSGKGQAVQEALRGIEATYVLMLDGDGTYRAEDADAMLEPLFSGEADHVIGDRFADMKDDSMSSLNRFGNRAINRAFARIHGEDFRDILSGYRAFTQDAIARMHLTAEGFTIETEIAVECAKHRIDTAVVPITYLARPDDSETNLNPIRDGWSIIFTLYQLTKTSNPMFYFGSVGAMISTFGLFLGTYVGVEWITRRVSHEVLAVVAGLAIVFGVQLLLVGFLSDVIVTLHREQMRRLEDELD